MELLSNCCGARVDGLNSDNIGICSECKEGCGIENEGLIILDKGEARIVSETCVNSNWKARFLCKGDEGCQCSFGECKVRVSITYNGHDPYEYILTEQEIKALPLKCKEGCGVDIVSSHCVKHNRSICKECQKEGLWDFGVPTEEGCGVEEVENKEILPYTRTDRIIDALLAIKEIGLLTPGEGEEDIDFLEEKINEIIVKLSEQKQ